MNPKEKPILYRRYVTLHGIILCAALAIAAAWIILSAARHSTATSNCLQRFFTEESLQDQGQRLCDIFSWVDVGIMGGLWLLLAIVQVGTTYLSSCTLADWFGRATSCLSCLLMALRNGGVINNTTSRAILHIP